MAATEATKLENINSMPAPTWHWLRMNGTALEIPADIEEAHAVSVESPDDVFAAPETFDEALAATQKVWEEAHPEPFKTTALIDEGKDDDILYGGTALSRYQEKADAVEAARDLKLAFTTGMGQDAFDYLREIAGDPIVIATKPGQSVTASISVDGIDGAINVAAIDLVAAKGSEITLYLNVDAPEEGTGFAGSSLRAFAGEDARITIVRTQTLDDSWTDIDDMGLFTWNGSRINVRQTVLGATNSFTDLAGDLRGERSRIDVDVRYLGHGAQKEDFNYTLRHHGEKTVCNIKANGVLANESKKTFRGTIDLVRGCKGAEGQETETVLLVDDAVENKTTPVILCNEDDVVGNHGATIGHVRPDQMFYLASRGLSQAAAEQMFVRAMLEQAAIDAPNAASRNGVVRLGEKLVGDFSDFLDVEEA